MDFHSVPAETDNDTLKVLKALAHGHVVESGTYLGKSARALAKVADHVDTCDPCDQCWNTERNLPANVTAHHCQGIDFVPERAIDFLYLDSGTDRADEIAHFKSFMANGSLMAIGDPGLPGIYAALNKLELRYISITPNLLIAQV